METVLRAKMRVQSVEKTPYDSYDEETKGQKTEIHETVKLQAVSSNDGDVNEQWSKWTPNGELSLSISNPDACGKVQAGDYVFVDLIPCEKDSI